MSDLMHDGTCYFLTDEQNASIDMKRNIGNLERGVRVVAGLGLTALAFVGPQNLWFLLGLIPLATGLIGWCPPYALLGISTNKDCGASPGSKSAS